MPGHDLAPLVTSDVSTLSETHAIIETGAGVAIRTPDQLCYLPYAGGHRLAAHPTMVYDLAEDPYQFDNLAQAGALPSSAVEPEALLRAWDAVTPWM